MNEYIIFMFNDATNQAASEDDTLWSEYISKLRQTGQFDGGSSIGGGERFRKGQATKSAITEISGFIRVRADCVEAAKNLLVGNPAYEAGASIDIRELIKE